MDEQQDDAVETSGSLTYYLLGAVVLALVVGGVYFLRPKSSLSPSLTGTESMGSIEVSPTPGPITGLACERQWYNPVVGFPKYFLGAEGGDFMTTKNVMCDFTVSVGGRVVATSSAQSGLTEAASRGGGTFHCVSKELPLEPNVPTVVDVTLKNDAKETATCTQTFVFPQP